MSLISSESSLVGAQTQITYITVHYIYYITNLLNELRCYGGNTQLPTKYKCKLHL